MAEVFAGMVMGAEGFEKPVAIKRMLPKLADDRRFARMFISEARLAKFLHHQNIVEIIDVGLSGSGLFLVMELVNGWDLQIIIEKARKKKRTFPFALAAYVTGQILAGLCHAYRRKVNGKPLLSAHRDISASNILLSAEGEVKVADFGVARLSGMNPVTEIGTFKGKLAYAAPELFTGAPANHLSDQFALGNVLYQMLSTQLPFGRPTNDLAEFLRRVKRTDPLPLTEIPGDLNQIVVKMLSKRPEDRFEEPDRLARALAEFLSGSGVPAGAGELTDFLSELELPAPVSASVEPPLLTTSELQISSELSRESTRELRPNEVFTLHSWPPEPEQAPVPELPSMDASGRIYGIEKKTATSGFTCMSCGKPLKNSFWQCDNCAGQLELDHMKMRRKKADAPSDAFNPLPKNFDVVHKPRPKFRFKMRWALVASCILLFTALATMFIWPELSSIASR